MAQYIFGGDDVEVRTGNTPRLIATGTTVEVFRHPDGTNAVHDFTDPATNENFVTLQVNENSQLPVFATISDSVDTLYVRVDGGDIYPIYAQVGQQMSILAGQAANSAQRAEAAADIAEGYISTANDAAVTTLLQPDSGSSTLDRLSSVISGIRNISGALRPRDFVKTYNVNASLASSSPAFSQFRTLNEAITQCVNDKRAEGNGTISEDARSNGARWRKIRLAAGTYDAAGVDHLLPAHTALVGATGSSSDVLITSAGAENTVGAALVIKNSGYVADVTVQHTGPGDLYHAVRVAGSTLKYDATTIIMDNVRMIASTAATANASALDISSTGGAFILVNQCSIIADSMPSAVTVGMNLSSTSQRNGTVVFLDNRMRSNYNTWTQPASGTKPTKARVVNVTENGQVTGRGDRFVWVGGTWDIGRATGSAGALTDPDAYIYVGLASGVNAAAIGSTYQIDNKIKRVSVDPLIPSNKVSRNAIVPLLPVDGMTEYERTFFTRSAAPVITSVREALPVITPPNGPDGVPGSTRSNVVPYRVYWIRVPIEKAMATGVLSANVAATSGSVALAWALDNNGVPDTNAANNSTPYQVNVTSVGTIYTTAPKRIQITPGMKYIWLAVASSVDAMFNTMNVNDGSVPVYYADNLANTYDPITVTSSLTPLANGALYPVPSLWADFTNYIDPDGVQKGVGSPLNNVSPLRAGTSRYLDFVQTAGAREWANRSIYASVNDEKAGWRVMRGESPLALGQSVPSGWGGSTFFSRSDQDAIMVATLTSWAQSSGSNGTNIPLGYRPRYQGVYGIVSTGGTVGSVQVYPNGQITWRMSAAGSGSGNSVYLVARWQIDHTDPANAWPGIS